MVCTPTINFDFGKTNQKGRRQFMKWHQPFIRFLHCTSQTTSIFLFRPFHNSHLKIGIRRETEAESSTVLFETRKGRQATEEKQPSTHIVQKRQRFDRSIMISAIEWVPAGVADPTPKKYELSAAEMELIEMMEKQQLNGGDLEEQIEKQSKTKKEKKSKSKKNETKIELPKVDPNDLPADLRMDEYSSDEDENDDAVQGSKIGNLLVDDDDQEPVHQEEENEMKNDDDMESDEDSDDDLDDVPDTREYTPLDVEGLQNMGISHAGGNGPAYMDGDDGDDDDDDDNSEAEDVQIRADDALVVVAKTEDVSIYI